MSRKYKISDQQKLHFITFTVIDWIDVFTRGDYRDIFVDSVNIVKLIKALKFMRGVLCQVMFIQQLSRKGLPCAQSLASTSVTSSPVGIL
jgi:hypothetical protein